MPKLIKSINDAILVQPGEASKLAQRSTVADELFPEREAAEAETKENAKAIDGLQDALWAGRSRALLVILQGIDTSGKDGTVRAVFNRCGPLGVAVTAFGRPSEEELAHDFLWRIHMAAPKKGMIGVFNRSQYEDVLVVKVRGLAPADVVERRYEQINAFERHLTENGVTVLKFMLNISKDEQKERLQARLDDLAKNWKFNADDLEDRKLWSDYQKAYEVALDRCSTEHAPWRVVPSDRKWQRNAIISAVVRRTLEDMNPKYPKTDWKPSDFKIT
ncbi:PPK2 family polyphosphate kinase [Terricaulis silvestris]|uniref:Polyphosphate:nucleotide phosphotransferase, PPK2 family n=1 Tax=Terricaulis silvestris TaxID=2686094 RepID=A0A6I6MK23_9CAUL|nr:PPK2 family polyphosphate kinase [Terricaulis silvestris]QGZ95625.1 polyphosphate:nucleotide phosphotransferase, PPK2 family [Terricaulis silvestris]